MNSWRHSDSSTVRTRLLQHRLCLWNAHHPWTRYILFPSLRSVVVSFLSRNGQQISRTTKGPKWNPPQVLLRFVPVVYHRVTSYGTAWYSRKPWSQKKTSRNNCLEAALHWSLFKFFSNKSVRSIGGLRIVERACPHLVPGNQFLGTGTKWCCFHTLSTRYETVFIVTPFRPVMKLDMSLVTSTNWSSGLP